jgi:hypothetical protein
VMSPTLQRVPLLLQKFTRPRKQKTWKPPTLVKSLLPNVILRRTRGTSRRFKLLQLKMALFKGLTLCAAGRRGGRC